MVSIVINGKIVCIEKEYKAYGGGVQCTPSFSHPMWPLVYHETISLPRDKCCRHPPLPPPPSSNRQRYILPPKSPPPHIQNGGVRRFQWRVAARLPNGGGNSGVLQSNSAWFTIEIVPRFTKYVWPAAHEGQTSINLCEVNFPDRQMLLFLLSEPKQQPFTLQHLGSLY